MNSRTRLRVAFYLVTSDEDTCFTSIDDQREALTRHLESRRPDGWTLEGGRIYRDRMCPERPDRRAFARLLRAAGQGRLDLVLVYRLDRLALTMTGLLQVLQLLEASGVAVVSVSELFDTRRTDHDVTLSNFRLVRALEGDPIPHPPLLDAHPEKVRDDHHAT